MPRYQYDRCANIDEAINYQVTKYFMSADGITALGWIDVAHFAEEIDAKEYCEWKNSNDSSSPKSSSGQVSN